MHTPQEVIQIKVPLNGTLSTPTRMRPTMAHVTPITAAEATMYLTRIPKKRANELQRLATTTMNANAMYMRL